MTQNVDPGFLAALQSQSAAIATCWKIDRVDGLVLAFTDADTDLVIDGVTYQASCGFSRTASESATEGEPQNIDLQSFFHASGIQQDDLRSGLYHMARVLIFLVNRKDLPSNLSSQKKRILGRCIITTAEFDALEYVVKLRSVSELLKNQIGFELTENCTHDFCDVGSNPYSRCHLHPAGYQATGTVTFVGASYQIFRWGVAGEPDGKYQNGQVTFTSGNNAGFKSRVEKYLGGTQQFHLYDLPPRPITVGDQFTVLQGCQKTPSACQSYGNYANFGGAPGLPGNDAYLNPEIESV